MPIGAVAPFRIVLQPFLQIGFEFRQSAFVAGLLGKGIVQGGEFPGLQVQQGDRKGGLSARGLLLRIRRGEGAGDITAGARVHADDSLHEAGNHPTILQLHLHALAAAAFDGGSAVGVHAAEADSRHVAHGRGPSFHRHQGGQLATRLLQKFVHPGGIKGDGDGFRFQSLRRF